MKKDRKKRILNSNQVFDIVNVIIMVALLIIFIWPLWFVVVASFSEPNAVMRGETLLFPKGFNLDGYKAMMKETQLWTGYANTIFYTLVGTLLNLVMSVFCAYPLSAKDFLPRKFFLVIFMITMYFSGGLIPHYLVVKQLGILDTRWALLLPSVISVYNCLILKTYFTNSIPGELKQAAFLDGANSFQYLVKVVLPLSKPALAVVGLYYAVAHWNEFYNALIYLQSRELYPLQSVLREILIGSKLMADLDNLGGDAALLEQMRREAEAMKYCVIIAAALPMLCIYPFIQRFFVKGVMVGSVKG